MNKTDGEFNSLYAGLGAKGYDVVAYHTLGAPTPGKEEFQHAHGGVAWRFASAEHLTSFKADPLRYVPQYGGFCSWGVAQGKLFDVDPANGWKIVNGKLYLNFNPGIQGMWEEDIAGFVAKADANWPRLNT